MLGKSISYVERTLCLLGGTILAMLLLTNTASAATLSATGATNVDVGGTLYDVAFVDGSCQEIFGGCDATSDFTFDTRDDAEAAATSLMAVFQENAAFNDDPRLISGCESSQFCLMLVPYGLSDIDVSFSAYTNNVLGGPADFVEDSELATFTDTRARGEMVYTVWTPVSEVPVPASMPLLMVGVAGFWAIRRRSKRT